MENYTMKPHEILILSEMRNNSRKKISDISRKHDIPITTVFQTLNRNSKYIKKHTTLFDFSKLSYAINVFYYIRVNSKFKIDFESHLNEAYLVNSAYRSNDGNSYLFDAYFKNIKQMHEFEEQLEDFNPLKMKKHEILDVVSRETFLQDPEVLFKEY